MPGLGTTFGRGGATTFAADLQHSDSILIMGSNMAECHPVAFRWVMQAKTRSPNPCTLIHADPRFTRTSAMADIYAPVRAGSDIVFLGALIHFVVDKLAENFAKPAERLTERERFFRDYVGRYTNAGTLIGEHFWDTEDADLGGVFSGLDEQQRKYDASTWSYDPAVGPNARQDPTLQDERCVFQILRQHYRRYTPERVEEVCGTPREVFLKVAETLWNNSGPDRTSAVCYAVGWTQHTTGVQMIRAAAILQLLLGNIGRPGGGILALRGHATIQGSTDIATLYNLLPGYLAAPSAQRNHDTLDQYIATETAVTATSYWSNFRKFIVSQLRAWYGDVPPAEAYQFLPKTVGDHSHMPMFVEMMKGTTIKGLFAMGQNPAVGGQNASFQRQALAQLDWLVVRDLYETETASFWKDSPEVANGKLRPQDIKTAVFFFPAAAVPEMDGSFTNTQRLVQWHDKAVDPPGDARSDIWFTFHLGRLIRDLYQAEGKNRDRDRPIRSLTWDYVDAKANADWKIKDEPSAELILKEINGYAQVGQTLMSAPPLSSFTDLKDDGSTACGAWIYSGIYKGGKNQAANRTGDAWVSPGWGFAWPGNRHILYNRASADPLGAPWAKEARLAAEFARNSPPLEGRGSPRGYVWWDETLQRWLGLDEPDFPLTKRPDAAANPNGEGIATHDGASPFILRPDGKGWLFVPVGLVDGPLPTHYEPYESPVGNLMYPRQQQNPVALTYPVPGNAYAPVGSAEYPHVLSTYRLTEHHLSGTMSRWLPWLAELQPELFCEISPEHAAEIGVANTEWVVISTPRGAIRAKALVTRRIRPYRLKERTVHHVGLPWHWGYKGLSRGDVVNDLTALVGDPNVSIHEAKVFVCQVRKG